MKVLEFIINFLFFCFLKEKMLYSQIDYDVHLMSELKTKNKQITFLEDKIILMQKEKQSKIQEIQHKFSQRYKKIKYLNSTLQQQNCQLRHKLQALKSKLSTFSQQYKKSFQESKELLQLKYMNEEQVKKIKAKLQKQKKNNHKLQQENLQLKTVLTINQKTIKELNTKIIKMNQQKNTLLRTYGDYDQIKHDLGEISKIYQDQYEGELQLVKNRLRCQMQENTKHIMNEFSLNSDLNLSNVDNSQTKMIRRTKSTQFLATNYNNNNNNHSNNENQKQKQSKNQIKIDDLKQKNESFPILNLTKTIQKNSLNNKQQISTTWQSDMINLKNYIEYGNQYVTSFKEKNLYQKESKQIYKFIQNTLNEKEQAIREKDQMSQKLAQMKEQMEQRMVFIEETMKQFKAKDVDRVNSSVQTVQSHAPLLRVSDLNIMLKNKIKECGQIISYLTGIFMVLGQIHLNNNYKIQKYYKPLINRNNSHKEKQQRAIKAKNKLKSIFLSVFFVQCLKKRAKKTKRLQKMSAQKSKQIQKLSIQDPKICKLVQKCNREYQRAKLQKSFQNGQNCQISKYILSTSTSTISVISASLLQKKYSIKELISRFLNQQILAILNRQKLQFSYNF